MVSDIQPVDFSVVKFHVLVNNVLIADLTARGLRLSPHYSYVVIKLDIHAQESTAIFQFNLNLSFVKLNCKLFHVCMPVQ